VPFAVRLISYVRYGMALSPSHKEILHGCCSLLSNQPGRRDWDPDPSRYRERRIRIGGGVEDNNFVPRCRRSFPTAFPFAYTSSGIVSIASTEAAIISRGEVSGLLSRIVNEWDEIFFFFFFILPKMKKTIHGPSWEVI